MSLSLRVLEHLRVVAEAGSYSAAARQLGLTQPAVSQQIKRLEQDYRVSLFARENGRLVPTPLCERLSEAAERVIQEHQSAENLLRRHGALAGGDISIGLGNAMPGMSVIAAFNTAFPQVSLRVETGSHDRIIRKVLAHEVDIGILPDIPADQRFRREPLLTNTVVAIVGLGHPMAQRSQVSVRDLVRERLIFRARGSSTQKVVNRVFRDHRIEPKPFLTLDTRDGVYEAVVNGMGVGFVWQTGSGRNDDVRQLILSDAETRSTEVAFTPRDREMETLDAFFSSVETWRKARDGAVG